MFIPGSSVQFNAHHFHLLSDAIELPIHENVSYFEASSVVCIDNLLKRLDDCWLSFVYIHFNCPEPYCPRECHNEWDFIDVHYICGQC